MIQNKVRVVVVVLACSLGLAEGASSAQQSGPIGPALAREARRQPSPEPMERTPSGDALSRLNQFQGRSIYLTGWQFSERLARCVRATATDLTVMVGGVEQRMARRDIRRVSIRGDSLRNGILFGAAIGFVSGAATGGSGSAVGGALFYGGVGGWIDSRRTGRTVIYEAR